MPVRDRKPGARLPIVLGTLLALGTWGCATITLDLPDKGDVDEVSLGQAPMATGGALRVDPAPGGEVLTYRFKYYRRGMDTAEWNPFLADHLKRELHRRGIDTRRGRNVTVRLVEFEAGEIALEVGRRVELVVEFLGDGFHKQYTGSGSGIWISLKGAMGEATSDVLAQVLSDEAFQALAR